jgi:hypothetical protein
VRALVTTLLAPVLVSSVASAQSQTREGLWGHVAVGWGSHGCEACAGRTPGFTGGIAIGGTFNQHLRAALAADGWIGTISTMTGAMTDTGTELAATLMPILQLYPAGRAGFFVSGGGGFGFASEPATLVRINGGPASLVGAGYDIAFGNGATLTAAVNRFGIHSERNRTDFLQAVVAITFN